MEEAKKRKPMTKTNKNKEWLELCEWVEREIFGYDENQKLHQAACLRLKGLQKGQVYANNKARSGNYPFNVVLNTFKIDKLKILSAIKGKTFRDEENEMAYICAIVSKDINEMYIKMKNANISERKVDNSDVTLHTKQEAEYHRQTQDVSTADKFEDLW